MRWFVGGQQRLMPELLAMIAPTVNSYRRLIPGFWAPTDATWGVENRTMRAARDSGQRRSRSASSIRVAAADCEPVHHSRRRARPRDSGASSNEVEPEPLVDGNAYDRKFPARLALPRTLWDAAQRLKGSKMARDWFGERFVEHFAATREWEEREFRKHISDWELARYFEII